MEIPSINIKDIVVAETDLVHKDTLHIGRLPDGEQVPHNIVALFDTPNAGSQLTTEKNTSKNTDRYEYAAVQARIRDKSYPAAMRRGKELVDVLHGRGNEVINQTKITVQALDNPSLLTWDDNNRAHVVVNFEVQQTTP